MGLWPIKNTAGWVVNSSKPKITGQFGKGNPGKPKGAVNHVTKSLKEMILGALDKAGGESYLQAQAEANPGPFLTLIGKVLPSTMALTGPEGKDLKITFEVIRPSITNKELPKNASDLHSETKGTIGG